MLPTMMDLTLNLCKNFFFPSRVYPFSETSNSSECSFPIYKVRVGKGDFLMPQSSILDILKLS